MAPIDPETKDVCRGSGLSENKSSVPCFSRLSNWGLRPTLSYLPRTMPIPSEFNGPHDKWVNSPPRIPPNHGGDCVPDDAPGAGLGPLGPMNAPQGARNSHNSRWKSAGFSIHGQWPASFSRIISAVGAGSGSSESHEVFPAAYARREKYADERGDGSCSRRGRNRRCRAPGLTLGSPVRRCWIQSRSR